MTMIVDICLIQKLGWMTWYSRKTTSESIGKAGSSHKNGSAPIRLLKYLKKSCDFENHIKLDSQQEIQPC